MPIPRSYALLFLVATQATAQDPWAAVRQVVINGRSPDAFTLIATDPRLNVAWYGDHPLGAADYWELRLLPLDKGRAKEALTGILKGPGWALFDPSANRIGEGPGLPTPEKVQELMEGAGWKPLLEALKAHLRQHGEDGGAWLELAYGLAHQAVSAKLAGTLSTVLRARLKEELRPCLQRLTEIPGTESLWREPSPRLFSQMFFQLTIAGLDQDEELRGMVDQLRSAIPSLITREPATSSLWHVLSLFDAPNRIEPQGEIPRNLLASLEAPPGRPWPPPFLAGLLPSFYAERTEEALRIATIAIARNQEPRVASRLGRPQVLEALASWGTMQFDILLYKHKFDEATALLAALRVQAGQGWHELTPRLEESLGWRLRLEDEGKKGTEERLNASQVETLRKALQEPPLADPPAPDCSPLRVALLESPTDPFAWGKLQVHEALMPWGPSELSWQPLKKEGVTRLRERHDWPQGQRWLLMKKDEVLASGPGMPTPRTLETALRGQGMPELEELGAFIKAHPERLDARRARLELLRPRLPNPYFESLFLQDLEATGDPTGPLPFEPDPTTWGPVARRVGLRCSERLRSWPFNVAAWTCYASWSPLDPKLPRPAALLSMLGTWPRQRGLRLPGPIPLAASKAVVETLRDQGRHGDIDAWMRVLWERGLKTWVAQWSALPPLGRNEWGGWLDRDAPDVKRLMAVWGEALAKGSDKAPLKALQAELEDLRAGLSRLLLRSGDLRQDGPS